MFGKKAALRPNALTTSVKTRVQTVACKSCHTGIDILRAVPANLEEFGVACPNCGRRHIYALSDIS